MPNALHIWSLRQKNLQRGISIIFDPCDLKRDIYGLCLWFSLGNYRCNDIRRRRLGLFRLLLIVPQWILVRVFGKQYLHLVRLLVFPYGTDRAEKACGAHDRGDGTRHR